MAHKKILTESEIRRFMKLADMRPVSEESLHTIALDEVDGEEEVEDVEVAFGEEGADVPPMDEPDPLADMPMDEPAMDEPAGPPSLDDEQKMTDFLELVADAARETLGIEMDVQSSADADLDEPAPVADLPGEEGGEMPEEPAEVDFEAAAVEVEDEEPVGYRDHAMQEKKIVEKVAKRVAARLVKEHKKVAMVDQLTERIFDRLTKK